MIYENVELHNIEEVHKAPGAEGVRLQRVPEHVRAALNPMAQERMLNPANAEIRFVSDAPAVKVTLSAPEGAEAVLFFGSFQCRERFSFGPQPRTIELAMPETLTKLPKDLIVGQAFSPGVFRLVLSGEAIHFHGVEGDGVRPPAADELPALRYLAYGTSITHGTAASGPHLAYAAQAARRLGADLINLGVGGSAHCEHELADYIAARKDWHIATLALSVNMIAAFTTEQFYERVSYMVNTVAGADTSRPVACITIYPCVREFIDQSDQDQYKGDTKGFRRALRQAVESCPHPNAHLIEGPEILTDIAGLTPDLVHPSDCGMIQMGENLARRLRPLAEGLV